MRTDHVPACIELANLFDVKKAAMAYEIRRHEAVRAHAARFERVCNDRVKRNTAIVERHPHVRVCVPPAFAAFGRTASASARHRIQLRAEFANRQLVAIGRGRIESALRRVAHEDVMKQQGYGHWLSLVLRRSSTGSNPSAEVVPTPPICGRP